MSPLGRLKLFWRRWKFIVKTRTSRYLLNVRINKQLVVCQKYAAIVRFMLNHPDQFSFQRITETQAAWKTESDKLLSLSNESGVINTELKLVSEGMDPVLVKLTVGKL